MLWMRTPDKVYFKKGCTPVALEELRQVLHKSAASLSPTTSSITTASPGPFETKLDEMGIVHTCFFDVEPDPSSPPPRPAPPP